MAAVNYVLRPFEGNINTGYPTGFKLNIQATKDIDKGTDKLNISVSNAKDIVDHFFSFARKYILRRLSFMVVIGKGAMKSFRVVEQIQI